jgi:4-diphosphocytidyl-2-C-methyl-D-erythritol kinase
VILAAPAKINLYLDILHKRPDGFHELRTLFHRTGLQDSLRLEAVGPRKDQADPLVADLRVDGPRELTAGIPLNEGNLVWRALVELDRVLPEPLPRLEILLEKRIPHGAGLGGGSSDAATALLLGNRLAPRPLPEEELRPVAGRIGSDCAFFTLPDGAAVGAGRGEVLTPAPAVMLPCLLVLPPFGISTREAYGRLTPELLGARSDANAALDWLEAGATSQPPRLENSFEAALEPVHPELRQIREELSARGAILARLSGSGSAVFGLFRDPSDCRRAARAMEPKWHCIETELR